MRIIRGECLEEMKKLPDNSVDAVVTDPPYGLGKEPNAHEVLSAWLREGTKEMKGGGFMGKEWDSFVPPPIIWRECYRILKPGGHMLVACGTRTQDWMGMSLRLAGFEIRDVVGWVYGSGLSKSHNVGKAVDKIQGNERQVVGKERSGLPDTHRTYNMANLGGSAMGGEYEITKGTSEWEGWGTGLKPAMELWTLCRKPISEKNVAENVLKWGTGALNIDGSRVSHNEPEKTTNRTPRPDSNIFSDKTCGFKKETNHVASASKKGRFPANLIWSHHPDCKFVGHKEVKSNAHYPEMDVNGYGKNYGGKTEYIAEGERPESETVEEWECVAGCPALEFAKAGESKSTGGRIGNKGSPMNMSGTKYQKGDPGFGDKGTPARFFYCAKPSNAERDFGLCEEFEKKQHVQWQTANGTSGKPSSLSEGRNTQRKNTHVTVKPVTLMQYLCRLITPPGGTVIDPFMGSGTTGMACKVEGFDFIGIEKEVESFLIAEARIEHVEYGMDIAKACRAEKRKEKKVEKVAEPNRPSVTLADFSGVDKTNDG